MQPNKETKRRLDRRIEELEQHLTRIRALRAAMDDDAIAEEMALVFGQVNGQVQKRSRGESKSFRKVAEFFRNRNNVRATVLEIMAGTKLTKNSVRQVLYVAHKDDFEREGNRGAQRQSKFWLKAIPEGKAEEGKDQ